MFLYGKKKQFSLCRSYIILQQEIRFHFLFLLRIIINIIITCVIGRMQELWNKSVPDNYPITYTMLKLKGTNSILMQGEFDEILNAEITWKWWMQIFLSIKKGEFLF